MVEPVGLQVGLTQAVQCVIVGVGSVAGACATTAAAGVIVGVKSVWGHVGAGVGIRLVDVFDWVFCRLGGVKQELGACACGGMMVEGLMCLVGDVAWRLIPPKGFAGSVCP